MKELLKVPFYKDTGDGNQCMQVCMKSVIKYFLNKEYSLGEIDKLTGKKDGKWSYTVQGVETLHSLGLNVKYYSTHNVKLYLRGEKHIRKTFGDAADKILKYTDLPILMKKVERVLKYDIFKKRRLSLAEIANGINAGCISIVLIDNNKITNKQDIYQGHFVTVTGIDNKYVYYHDSGPVQPVKNKKVLKSIFREARKSAPTKNSVIVICGKKQLVQLI